MLGVDIKKLREEDDDGMSRPALLIGLHVMCICVFICCRTLDCLHMHSVIQCVLAFLS